MKVIEQTKCDHFFSVNLAKNFFKDIDQYGWGYEIKISPFCSQYIWLQNV